MHKTFFSKEKTILLNEDKNKNMLDYVIIWIHAYDFEDRETDGFKAYINKPDLFDDSFLENLTPKEAENHYESFLSFFYEKNAPYNKNIYLIIEFSSNKDLNFLNRKNFLYNFYSTSLSLESFKQVYVRKEPEYNLIDFFAKDIYFKKYKLLDLKNVDWKVGFLNKRIDTEMNSLQNTHYSSYLFVFEFIFKYSFNFFFFFLSFFVYSLSELFILTYIFFCLFGWSIPAGFDDYFFCKIFKFLLVFFLGENLYEGILSVFCDSNVIFFWFSKKLHFVILCIFFFFYYYWYDVCIKPVFVDFIFPLSRKHIFGVEDTNDYISDTEQDFPQYLPNFTSQEEFSVLGDEYTSFMTPLIFLCYSYVAAFYGFFLILLYQLYFAAFIDFGYFFFFFKQLYYLYSDDVFFNYIYDLDYFKRFNFRVLFYYFIPGVFFIFILIYSPKFERYTRMVPYGYRLREELKQDQYKMTPPTGFWGIFYRPKALWNKKKFWKNFYKMRRASRRIFVPSVIHYINFIVYAFTTFKVQTKRVFYPVANAPVISMIFVLVKPLVPLFFFVGYLLISFYLSNLIVGGIFSLFKIFVLYFNIDVIDLFIFSSLQICSKFLYFAKEISSVFCCLYFSFFKIIVLLFKTYFFIFFFVVKFCFLALIACLRFFHLVLNFLVEFLRLCYTSEFINLLFFFKLQKISIFLSITSEETPTDAFFELVKVYEVFIRLFLVLINLPINMFFEVPRNISFDYFSFLNLNSALEFITELCVFYFYMLDKFFVVCNKNLLFMLFLLYKALSWALQFIFDISLLVLPWFLFFKLLIKFSTLSEEYILRFWVFYKKFFIGENFAYFINNETYTFKKVEKEPVIIDEYSIVLYNVLVDRYLLRFVYFNLSLYYRLKGFYYRVRRIFIKIRRSNRFLRKFILDFVNVRKLKLYFKSVFFRVVYKKNIQFLRKLNEKKLKIFNIKYVLSFIYERSYNLTYFKSILSRYKRGIYRFRRRQPYIWLFLRILKSPKLRLRLQKLSGFFFLMSRARFKYGSSTLFTKFYYLQNLGQDSKFFLDDFLNDEANSHLEGVPEEDDAFFTLIVFFFLLEDEQNITK